jgi:hypothetical protein
VTGRHWPHWGNLPEYPMGNAATIALTLMIAAFLMASWGLCWGLGYAKLVRVLPALHDKKTALHIVYDVERDIFACLRIVSGMNFLLGMAAAAFFTQLARPCHCCGVSSRFSFGWSKVKLQPAAVHLWRTVWK